MVVLGIVQDLTVDFVLLHVDRLVILVLDQVVVLGLHQRLILGSTKLFHVNHALPRHRGLVDG